jgi:hypothetical protein
MRRDWDYGLDWRMDFRRHLCVLLLCSVTAMNCEAQQAAPAATKVDALRVRVGRLSQGAPISVVRVHADEEYGKFGAAGQDDFTFYDVDLKKDVTLRYGEVKKVKDGYGGYNTVRHRHTDRTKAVVIGILVLGVLGAVVIAAARD